MGTLRFAHPTLLNEMKRFDESFVHLNSDSLRYCLEETAADGEWPQRFTRAIQR